MAPCRTTRNPPLHVIELSKPNELRQPGAVPAAPGMLLHAHLPLEQSLPHRQLPLSRHPPFPTQNLTSQGDTGAGTPPPSPGVYRAV